MAAEAASADLPIDTSGLASGPLNVACSQGADVKSGAPSLSIHCTLYSTGKRVCDTFTN